MTDAFMQKHFVTFYSPGTFVHEVTTRAIDKWDVDKAVEMARGIVERYNARPYGFRFSTRARSAGELDSKVTRESAMYYLGGKVETLAEVEARNDPKEEILRANMRGNDWPRIIVNDNSWRWTQPLEDDDVVLDVKL
jgi:hypothetical protein